MIRQAGLPFLGNRVVVSVPAIRALFSLPWFLPALVCRRKGAKRERVDGTDQLDFAKEKMKPVFNRETGEGKFKGSPLLDADERAEHLVGGADGGDVCLRGALREDGVDDLGGVIGIGDFKGSAHD